jgi:hypothetical protein
MAYKNAQLIQNKLTSSGTENPWFWESNVFTVSSIMFLQFWKKKKKKSKLIIQARKSLSEAGEINNRKICPCQIKS